MTKRELKVGDYVVDDYTGNIVHVTYVHSGGKVKLADDHGQPLPNYRNPENLIRVAKPRTKNPAPRVGTKRPRRVSQVTKKPPTKRLVTRRKANVKPGYFPNPVIPAEFTKFNGEFTRALEVAQTKHKDKLVTQARLSYVQGMLVAGEILGAVTATERASFLTELRKIAG